MSILMVDLHARVGSRGVKSQEEANLMGKDSGNPSSVPVLEGDARRAVEHRGGHLQIIAAAGSGKTEVVSQRVASLIADGEPSEGIVAFTFTERAADELKLRIASRVAHRNGPAALDRLGPLFVGTIHAYCFGLLQRHVPRYETYDVLDDNQLTAFLTREARSIGLKDLQPDGRLFAAIGAFLCSVDVVENELLDPATMPSPFREVLLAYLERLERYRLLTYGQQIVRAVRELEDGPLADLAHGTLRHLIVDEYQDVNPAQERLVELLAGPQTALCVVGDDDQAIYQWRGSDVANIVTFTDRYPDVATFDITTNRRSRPGIIATANRFVASIPGRLDKTMQPSRDPLGTPDVVLWAADTEPDEADQIARHITALHARGLPYAGIGVLVRSRTCFPRLLEAFQAYGIPVQPGGRTALFTQPEAELLGRTIAWLTKVGWATGPGPRVNVGLPDLLSDFQTTFSLTTARRDALRGRLEDWKALVPKTDRSADLVGELYQVLEPLGIRDWDLSDPLQVNRIGTLARFTALLADYESVRRRARRDEDAPGEQVGGQDRGEWYYKNLAIHVVNYAVGAYEDFDGEQDVALDAVDLTTVHRAKGLEWPAVFVPSMTSRFPSSKVGAPRDWLVPRERFAAARYEGTDQDERRLFYVAITRGRDWLSVSRHRAVNVRATKASPYYTELSDLEVDADAVEPPALTGTARSQDAIALTYSELVAFLECGMAFRLRNRIGFQPRLAQELGYGKAIHHVLRTVAERTVDTGSVPSTAELDHILDHDFFLPTANKPAHRQMKEAARRLLHTYAAKHSDDLHRVWQTERPFELHLEGVVVTGRADVILDREDGKPESYAIVDYKTSTSGDPTVHALQLQVYADAGRREGLNVHAAYVHDLRASDRAPVDVDAQAVSAAEQIVLDAADRLRAHDFSAKPGDRCKTCEVRTLCGSCQR